MNAVDPELHSFIDKQIRIRLNSNRVVCGILIGFDSYMNLVLKDAVRIADSSSDSKQKQTKVHNEQLGIAVIRGQSISALDTI